MEAVTRSPSPPLQLEEVRKINSLPKALSVACLSLKVEIRYQAGPESFRGHCGSVVSVLTDAQDTPHSHILPRFCLL